MNASEGIWGYKTFIHNVLDSTIRYNVLSHDLWAYTFTGLIVPMEGQLAALKAWRSGPIRVELTKDFPDESLPRKEDII